MKNKFIVFSLVGIVWISIFSFFNLNAPVYGLDNNKEDNHKPKVVAVVPIKMNNQRCPGKNTKLFSDGKPLIHCILQNLKKASNIDEIYVYCSNENIKQYLTPDVKFKQRNKSLDSDKTSMNEVLLSFANEVDSDIYVLAHATAPFLKGETIEECVDKVLDNQYDSAFTVTKLNDFLWKDQKPINYNLNNIPRTQDLEPLYSETSGTYVFKKDLIKLENRRIGHNPYLKEIGKVESVDIDTPEDFMIASAIYDKVFKGQQSV